MATPTPEDGLRERVSLEIERQRSEKGDRISRHALTYLHPDLDTRQVRFGVWNKPQISLVRPMYYQTTNVDIGRLDNIASHFYNDSRLWWAIAAVNGIKNPFTDMEEGVTLVIPTKESIIEAVETGNRADFK